MQQHHDPRRQGFSILELLLVCTIIMILMGLTMGAVMRYKDVQQKLNTQLTLQKVDSMLRQHWNAVVNAAKDERISTQATNMAGSDSSAGARARVIHIKLRLRQEFPRSFAEIQGGGGLPPLQSYVNAIPAGTPTTVMGLLGNTMNVESAACLYMALQQNRNGTNTNVDTVLTTRESLTIPGTAVKYISDDWKSPIAFFRWPIDNEELNPTGRSRNQTENMDLEDPDGLLSMSGKGWDRATFSSLCYQIRKGQSFRLDPTVASAGRDGIFGLDQVDGSSGGLPPSSMKVNNTIATYDNLYSYRLRQTGRGD